MYTTAALGKDGTQTPKLVHQTEPSTTLVPLKQSRAKVTTELLKELNEAVAGSYVEEDPAVLLDSNPGFFSEFSLVVATQVRSVFAGSSEQSDGNLECASMC